MRPQERRELPVVHVKMSTLPTGTLHVKHVYGVYMVSVEEPRLPQSSNLVWEATWGGIQDPLQRELYSILCKPAWPGWPVWPSDPYRTSFYGARGLEATGITPRFFFVWVLSLWSSNIMRCLDGTRRHGLSPDAGDAGPRSEQRRGLESGLECHVSVHDGRIWYDVDVLCPLPPAAAPPPCRTPPCRMQKGKAQSQPCHHAILVCIWPWHASSASSTPSRVGCRVGPVPSFTQSLNAIVLS